MTPEYALHLYRSSCEGKRRFLTLAAARDSARKRRRREGAKGLSAYSCAFCGYAHRGHIPDGGRLDGFNERVAEAARIVREAAMATEVVR